MQGRSIPRIDRPTQFFSAHIHPATAGLPGGLYGEHRTVGVQQDPLGGAAREKLSHWVATSQADDNELDLRLVGQCDDLIDRVSAGADLDRVGDTRVGEFFLYSGHNISVGVPWIGDGVAA